MQLAPPPLPKVDNDSDSVAIVQNLVRDLGTAAHPHANRLIELGRQIPREIAADSLHFLSLLHGRKPSIFDIVYTGHHAGAGAGWVKDVAACFSSTRTFLAQLVVAAGPPPSLFRQMQTEEVAGAMRRALLTLARSDREGCALGAANTLARDWIATERVIQALSKALGIESMVRHYRWPDQAVLDEALHKIADQPLIHRAVTFGARTLISQNRAFWDMLEARAQEIAKN